MEHYDKGEAPSTLVRWFWVIQFVAKYANHSMDADATFYAQLLAIVLFTLLLLRAISLRLLQWDDELEYDAMPKLSMQRWSGVQTNNDYSQLLDYASEPSRTRRYLFAAAA